MLKIFLGATSGALLLACLNFPSFAAPPSPPPAAHAAKVDVPSLATARAKIAHLWSCSPQMRAAYRASGLPQGDNLATIKAIDRLVRKQITYRMDESGEDLWTDFSATALAGAQTIGDCDDFTVTAVHLALCAGIPEEKLGLVLSASRGTRRNLSGVDHVFPYYRDGNEAVSFANSARRSVGPVRRQDGARLWQSVTGLKRKPDQFISLVPVQPGTPGTQAITANAAP